MEEKGGGGVGQWREWTENVLSWTEAIQNLLENQNICYLMLRE